MTRRSLRQLRTEEILPIYIEAARGYLHAIMCGNHKAANRRHASATRAFDELMKRGECNYLLPLLEHEEPVVRQWAATHALQFAPDRAVKVLEELGEASLGVPSLNAQITLQMWRKGEFPGAQSKPSKR